MKKIMKGVLKIKILKEFNRTNELKKSIVSILKPMCEKVYYRKASSKANYPYITYFLKHTKDEHKYDYFFEIHIWTKDIKLAEELADKVEKLDGCVYRNEYHSFDLDLNSRNNVEDEDKELQHIVLLFNLTYFSVKG